MGDVSSRFTWLTNFTDILCNAFIRGKELLTSVMLEFKNRTVVFCKTHNLFTHGCLLSLYHAHYLELI